MVYRQHCEIEARPHLSMCFLVSCIKIRIRIRSKGLVGCYKGVCYQPYRVYYPPYHPSYHQREITLLLHIPFLKGLTLSQALKCQSVCARNCNSVLNHYPINVSMSMHPRWHPHFFALGPEYKYRHLSRSELSLQIEVFP